MLICPHCSGHIADDPALAGQSLKCPHCSGAFQAPLGLQLLVDDTRPPPIVARRWAIHSIKQRRKSNSSSAMLAVFLSFLLPGLGQLTQGRGTVGACFMIGILLVWCLGLISWPAAWVVVADETATVAVAKPVAPFVWPAFFIGVIVTVWAMVDAGAYQAKDK